MDQPLYSKDYRCQFNALTINSRRQNCTKDVRLFHLTRYCHDLKIELCDTFSLNYFSSVFHLQSPASNWSSKITVLLRESNREHFPVVPIQGNLFVAVPDLISSRMESRN